MSNREESVHTEESEDEKVMGFFDHLEEMRWTLVKCAIAIMVTALLVGVFVKRFNNLLMLPLLQLKEKYPDIQIDLGTTSVAEVFIVIIQMVLVGALVIAAPAVLYFIGQFIAPALTKQERKVALPACISASLLFFAGAAFGYFVLLPVTMGVSVELNQAFNFITRWTPDSYYTILIWMIFGVGASFEFPILIVLAVSLGILQTSSLRKYRRHALVVILIIAAFVTPTTDPLTLGIFAGPLYFLYEIAIIVGSRIEKARKAPQETESSNS